jgi:hypothetical protein
MDIVELYLTVSYYIWLLCLMPVGSAQPAMKRDLTVISEG